MEHRFERDMLQRVLHRDREQRGARSCTSAAMVLCMARRRWLCKGSNIRMQDGGQACKCKGVFVPGAAVVLCVPQRAEACVAMPASGVRGMDFWAVESWPTATRERFMGTGFLTDVLPMMGMLLTRDCF